MVLDIKPTQVTLVPDGDDNITSDAGWNTIKNYDFLSEVVAEFKAAGIRTSIFVDPDLKMIEGAAKVGADRIELYTEKYAVEFEKGNTGIITEYAEAAQLANELGLGVNAGHDLSLKNIQFFAKNIPQLKEVSIGHALISEALYYGLQNVVNMYLYKLQDVL